jgi:carotenoid cleavage dioxygenase
VRWFKGPRGVAIHTLNADTQRNRLVLDAPISDGNPFPFFPDLSGAPWNPQHAMTTIRRWTFDLNSKQEGWQEENLFPTAPGALGRIDDRYASLPYRYSYMGYTDPTKPFDIVRPPHVAALPMTNCYGRFDMTNGKLNSYFGGSVGGLQEGCFVPRNKDAPEGDGYLVGVYGNLAEKRSELVVLDATNMEERARVILPFRVSEQVHGVWASHDDLPFASKGRGARDGR